VAVAANRVKIYKEEAAATALWIYKRNDTAAAKKQHQPEPTSKPKLASKRKPKYELVVTANGGRSDSAGPSALPPPPPPFIRLGRNIHLTC
jgi:hypothetical protein